MAITLAFFNDSGLSSPASNLSLAVASDGSTQALDRVVYLGSNAVGKKFQAASNPGVDQIQVSLVDTAVGSGVEAAHVKLATSQSGLNAAVAGAPVSIGTQILSGPSHSVAVYVRVDTPALAVGAYNDLSLATAPVIEVNA